MGPVTDAPTPAEGRPLGRLLAWLAVALVLVVVVYVGLTVVQGRWVVAQAEAALTREEP